MSTSNSGQCMTMQHACIHHQGTSCMCRLQEAHSTSTLSLRPTWLSRHRSSRLHTPFGACDGQRWLPDLCSGMLSVSSKCAGTGELQSDFPSVNGLLAKRYCPDCSSHKLQLFLLDINRLRPISFGVGMHLDWFFF